MSTKKLATVTCHAIKTYGNAAKHAIHAYQAGGERVVGMLNQRWGSALKVSRPRLAAGVARNANAVQQRLHSYAVKGLAVTSNGAESLVQQVVALAASGVHALSTGALRVEGKTGSVALTRLAQAALPGVTMLDKLATQVEQQSAHLADKVAADTVVVKAAKRVRTAARKPRAATAPTPA